MSNGLRIAQHIGRRYPDGDLLYGVLLRFVQEFGRRPGLTKTINRGVAHDWSQPGRGAERGGVGCHSKVRWKRAARAS